jgi:hypothetical protein
VCIYIYILYIHTYVGIYYYIFIILPKTLLWWCFDPQASAVCFSWKGAHDITPLMQQTTLSNSGWFGMTYLFICICLTKERSCLKQKSQTPKQPQTPHKHPRTHTQTLSLSHTRSISKKQTCLARYSHICQPISGKVCNLDKTHYFVTFTQLSDAQARERNNRCKNPWFKNAAESKKGLPWHHKPMDTLVHRYLTYSWCFKCLSVPCWHDPHLHTLSHLQKGTSLQGASWQLVEIGSNWGLNWSDALNDSLRFPEPLWALQSVSVSPAIWIASLWGHWAKCGRSAGLLWCCNFVKFQQSTVSTVQHMEQAAPTFDMRRVCARLPCPCCTGTSAESMLGLLTGSQAFKKTIEHIRKPYIINIYFHNLSTIFDWTSHYRHLVPLS